MRFMTADLYRYSIEKLAENKGSWPEIARECDVSYDWLCKFARNDIPNAAYVRVKRIASYFEARSKSRRKTDKH